MVALQLEGFFAAPHPTKGSADLGFGSARYLGVVGRYAKEKEKIIGDSSIGNRILVRKKKNGSCLN